LSEEESNALVVKWTALCPHPGGSDIIFWPNELGLCRAEELSTFHMTAEQMVDYAMSWQPRVVAMRVERRSGGGSTGYYLYKLKAPDTPATQIATPLNEKYDSGTTLAVALKGVRLSDGSFVEREFSHGVMSCGKILGAATEPVGTRLDSGDRDAVR